MGANVVLVVHDLDGHAVQEKPEGEKARQGLDDDGGPPRGEGQRVAAGGRGQVHVHVSTRARLELRARMRIFDLRGAQRGPDRAGADDQPGRASHRDAQAGRCPEV